MRLSSRVCERELIHLSGMAREQIRESEDGDDYKYYFSRDQAWEMLFIKAEETTSPCSVHLTHSIQLKK